MQKINITFSGREIEFIFGTIFMGEVVEVLDADVSEIHAKMKKNPFKVIPTLMYYSAYFAAESKGQALDLSKNELIALIDNDGGLFSDNARRFIEAFTKSIVTNLPDPPKAPGKKGGPKKKLTGTMT